MLPVTSPTDLDDWLSLALFGYRTSKQASTGESPNELLFGRRTKLPIDLELDRTFNYYITLRLDEVPHIYMASCNGEHEQVLQNVEDEP